MVALALSREREEHLLQAGAVGRPAAHALLEKLTQQTVATQGQLAEVLTAAISEDIQLSKHIDIRRVQDVFDPVQALGAARTLAERQLKSLLQSRPSSSFPDKIN